MIESFPFKVQGNARHYPAICRWFFIRRVTVNGHNLLESVIPNSIILCTTIQQPAKRIILSFAEVQYGDQGI